MSSCQLSLNYTFYLEFLDTRFLDMGGKGIELIEWDFLLDNENEFRPLQSV